MPLVRRAPHVPASGSAGAARRVGRLAPVLAGALLAAACSAVPEAPLKHYAPEDFNSVNTHTRNYPVASQRTCEAARQALLSQGYLISNATADQVTGRKNFQPESEVHLEMELRVVCTAAVGAAAGSTAFVTAVQDRYALKKSNNSASLGVSAIASVSLPFNAGSEAMVKVGSQTLADPNFYDRFFLLVERYIGAPEPPAPRAPQQPALSEPLSTPVAASPALQAQPLAAQPPAPTTAQQDASTATGPAPTSATAPVASPPAAAAPTPAPAPTPEPQPAPLTASQG